MRLIEFPPTYSWKESKEVHFPKMPNYFFHKKSRKYKEIPARLGYKKERRLLWPSTHHVERKPILTLFTTNSTFHSFYSLSWQLLPTRGNSLESNCQESTALVFRERERERRREWRKKKKRECELWRRKCGGTTGSSVKLQGSASLIPASH